MQSPESPQIEDAGLLLSPRITAFEAAGVLLSLVLSLALRLVALNKSPLNELFDEGVHLGLMKQVAENHAVLYRDLLFIHPPGVIWAGAAFWSPLQGEIFGLRIVYILFCSLLFFPIFVIARRLYNTKTAVLSLVLLAITPAFCGWIGRNIMLEPPLNVILYSAIALSLDSRSPMRLFVAGMTLGLGTIIKETALLIGFLFLLVIAADHWKAHEQKIPASFLAFVAGFALSGIGLFLYLNQIPRFWRDIVLLNARDPYVVAGRFGELLNGFYQMPLQMTLGIVAAYFLLRQKSRNEATLLGRFMLICGLVLFLLPKRFYWRHLLCLMPLCTIFAAAYLVHFGEQWKRQSPLFPRLMSALLIGLIMCVNAVSLAAYFFSERVVPPSYTTALSILKEQIDPVFTLNPIWVVAAHKRFVEGEFAVDSIYARQYGMITDAESLAILRQCPTVLLDRKTREQLSAPMREVLRTEYRSLYRAGVPEQKGYVEILTRISR